MASEGRFQVAVGAIIQNHSTGKVLLIHRSASQYAGDIWEFPIGRIHQFESLHDGLKREVAEETGINDIAIGRPISTFEFMRGEHSPGNEVRAVVFMARTSQENIKLSDEHDEYKWLLIEEAIRLAKHPGIKRDLQIFLEIRTI
jgi:8-oxo-dGTP diphosphatase